MASLGLFGGRGEILKENVIEGVVDTFPYDHTLGRETPGIGLGTAQAIDHQRRRFWQDTTNDEWVIRPRFCEEPWDHFVIPPTLRFAKKLKVGHWVRAEVRRARAGRKKAVATNEISEANHRLGRVRKILKINGFHPKNLPSVQSWHTLKDIEDPAPLLSGRLDRILSLVGARPSDDDAIIVCSEPESGKTFFLLELALEAAKNGVYVMYALIGERNKDIREAERQLKDVTNLSFFGIPGTKSVLKKIRGMELVIHYAMRWLELGKETIPATTIKIPERFLLVVDSGIKSWAGPITNTLAPRKGVGSQKGGMNPESREVLTVLWGLAKTTKNARLSVWTSFLDREALDIAFINSGRDTGDGIITLSYDANMKGIYPPLRPGRESFRLGGKERHLACLSIRGQEKILPKEFVQAAKGLNMALSFERCLREARTKHLNVDAEELALERQARFIEMVDAGASNEEIFAEFEIPYRAPISLAKEDVPMVDLETLPDFNNKEQVRKWIEKATKKLAKMIDPEKIPPPPDPNDTERIISWGCRMAIAVCKAKGLPIKIRRPARPARQTKPTRTARRQKTSGGNRQLPEIQQVQLSVPNVEATKEIFGIAKPT